MMSPNMQSAKVSTRRYVACPACGEGQSQIDHIDTPGKVVTFGPWYCQQCGAGFVGQIEIDGSVMVGLTGKNWTPTRCLVRLRPDIAELFFEVEHRAYGREPGLSGEDGEGQRYWFERGTCAVNFLRHAAETWVADADGPPECDPHGAFELIDERPAPDDPNENAFTAEDVAAVIRRATEPEDFDLVETDRATDEASGETIVRLVAEQKPRH